MGENSNIQWCDATYNFWEGCTKVSPGCKNCYAETLVDKRYGRVKWGKGEPRRLMSLATRMKPLKWNKDAGGPLQSFQEVVMRDGTIHRGTIEQMVALKLNESDMASANPARPRVFCQSLSDVFDEEVPDDWRYDLFGMIANCPNLDFLILTKRVEKAAAFFADQMNAAMCEGAAQNLHHERTGEDPSMWFAVHFPLPNVWLGTSVENQEMAEKRLPILAGIPAVLRFVSAEPLLEEVDMGLDCDDYWVCPSCNKESEPIEHSYQNELSRFECGLCKELTEHGEDFDSRPSISWVIFGGESGPGARPCNIDWIRDGVKQCRKAKVSPFVKQLGSDPRQDSTGIDFPGGGPVQILNGPLTFTVKDKKGGDMSEWPEDLRVREFPR